MYEKFLERLREIREFEYNDGCIMFCGEATDGSGKIIQKGYRSGEYPLEAIARHMMEVLRENSTAPKSDLSLEWYSKGDRYVIKEND